MSVNGVAQRPVLRRAELPAVAQDGDDEFFRRLALVGPAPRVLRDLADAAHALVLRHAAPDRSAPDHSAVPGHSAPAGEEPAGEEPARPASGRPRLPNGRYAPAARAAADAEPAGRETADSEPAGRTAAVRGSIGEAGPADPETEALMEHLGHLAANTLRPGGAEAPAGALVPLALRTVSPVPPAAVPRLIAATSDLVRGLSADPALRPLVRLVPGMLRRATAHRSASDGQAHDVVESLADEARRVLGDPAVCLTSYRESATADRRFHAEAGR